MFLEIVNSNQDELIMEVMDAQEWLKGYDLILTRENIVRLFEVRKNSLKDFGLIEVDGNTILKIIYGFSDSDYIDKNEYVNILLELIRIFYYYQNEFRGMLSDDEIIRYMRWEFDHECNGVIELLESVSLDKIKRMLDSGEYNGYY